MKKNPLYTAPELFVQSVTQDCTVCTSSAEVTTEEFGEVTEIEW